MKYTIVIPAYNAGLFLEECIQSVLNQTIDDYEIIVVDDASVDNTLAIVQNYISTDSRVRLIKHAYNKGELLSRKMGVENANGLFCLFLDQDDSLVENALELVNTILEKKQYDILSFGAEIIPEDGVDETHLQAAYSYFIPYTGVLEGKEIFEKCFREQSYPHNVWDKVYRTDLCKNAFNQITENNIAIGADIYTYFVFSYEAKSFLGIEDKLYKYHVGRGLTGQKTMTLQKFEMHCKQANLVIACQNFLNRKNQISIYTDIIAKLQKNGIRECITCYTHNISSDDAFEAAKLLLKYWGKEAVSKAVYEWSHEKEKDYFTLGEEYKKLQYYTGELQRIIEQKCWLFPYNLVSPNKNIVIYGAGKMGEDYVRQILQTHWGKVSLWIDQGKVGQRIDEIPIVGIEQLDNAIYDYIIIAISNVEVKEQIRNQLISRMGIEDKIII